MLPYNMPNGKPVQEQTYTRPVRAVLKVSLDNGEDWTATEDDLAAFHLVDIYETERMLNYWLQQNMIAAFDGRYGSQAEQDALRGIKVLAEAVTRKRQVLLKEGEVVGVNEDLVKLARLVRRALAAGITGDADETPAETTK